MDPSTTRSGAKVTSKPSQAPKKSKPKRSRKSKTTTPQVPPAPAPAPAPINVSIHGACKNNGQADAKASYGIIFPQAEMFNESGTLPDDERQASNAAVVFAARRALEIVLAMRAARTEAQGDGGVSLGGGYSKTSSAGDENLRVVQKVVVMTHSSYLRLCMKKWIKKWTENNFLDSREKEVVNRELIEGLAELVNEEGLHVEWVQCAREANAEAVNAANKAYGPPPLSRKARKIVRAKERANDVENVETVILHWMNVHMDDRGRLMAARLKIHVPAGRAENFHGFTPAIRRLVITGEDTEENFRLLFGEHWEAVVYPEWKHIRMEHLAGLEPGDLWYNPVGVMMDSTAPFKNLRPASEDEMKRIPLKKKNAGRGDNAKGDDENGREEGDWELLSDEGDEIVRSTLGNLKI